MRLVLASLLGILVLAAPIAAACGGLSPGDQTISDGASCTLAYIVANKDGLFFATAGHCVTVDVAAENPAAGVFGRGAFRYLEPDTGAATDGAPGEDFGLIRIDPEFYDRLNPAVCGWGGPTGIYTEAPGSGGVRHYGHGLIFGDAGPTTQKREGVALRNDNYAFYWIGAGVPGDSGSAVLSEDGRALGVLTHLRGASETNGGTHLTRGFELAKDAGYGDLRLVLEGEDPVAVWQALRDAPTPPPGVTPAPGNVTTPTNTTTNGTQSPGPQTIPTPVVQAGTVDGDDEAPPAAETPGPGLALVVVAALIVAFRKRHAR